MGAVTPPVVLVCGLGRCGLTLTMNMLAAGGVPCAGQAPAYEPREIQGVQHEWLKAQAGRAVKLVDPGCFGFPARQADTPPIIAIWLDRQIAQQARSQAKMAHLLAGAPMADRRHLKRWAANLPKARAEARQVLAKAGVWPQLELDFEAVLGLPVTASAMIADMLRPAFPLIDVAAMAAVVLDRPTRCAPDLAIELAMIERARAA